MVLLLANDDDSIGHRHVEFVLVVPRIRIAVRVVGPHVLLLVVLPSALDPFWHAHLLIYVLREIILKID